MLCWGLCPTETVYTMELGYTLTWHSEYGAGIEIPLVEGEMVGHLAPQDHISTQPHCNCGEDVQLVDNHKLCLHLIN